MDYQFLHNRKTFFMRIKNNYPSDTNSITKAFGFGEVEIRGCMSNL